MAKIEKVKYLIIGNSAGGIGAAETIRELDKDASITIVSNEPYPAYSRPLISEYLGERCPLERMLFRPTDFYKKHNIQAVLDKKVDKLDVANGTIELEDGSSIAWDKLLLATGGLPLVPEIEGIGLDGVFTFTTLDDAQAISQYLGRAAQAVVIGGGLIGVSVTEALVNRGVAVTIVEMKERILNTILDEEASTLAEKTLRQAGVNIVTDHIVARVSSNSAGETAVGNVILDDGSSIPCRLVIAAIGVQPRTKPALSTDIKVNHGIVVDRYMATSCPNVYACGDVAETYDFVYGENRVTPIWPNAYSEGMIAGFNMADIPTEYEGGTAMNSLRYFGMDVVSAGIINPPDNGYEVISNKYDNNYRKVVLKDGLVVGMVFAGNIEKSGIVFNLMKNKVNADGFKQALVAEDFGLISLPEEMWRAWLEVPTSGVISRAVSAKQPQEIVAGD